MSQKVPETCLSHKAEQRLIPKRKISVIQLLHTMAYGGIETIVINWMRHLDPSEIDLHLVCFENPTNTEKPFMDAAQAYGIHVDKIPWNRLKPVFRSTRALVQLVRKYQAEIIHTHNVYADLVGLIAGKWTGSKVMASHYVWGDFGLKLNLLQKFNQSLLPYFDHVTAQCEQTFQDSIRRGLRPERISVLGSGMFVVDRVMSSEERIGKRANLGCNNEHTVLVNVARLYPEKAHEFLLHCFREILDRCPQTRLWIAGIGPLEEELRAICTRLNLDHAVRWLGFVSDLQSVFAIADLQVHPALNEGIPLALLQGMAAGMPIVASAVGGVPEIVDGHEHGLLVPVNDKALFVNSVVSLIEDRERSKQIGEAARQYIRDEQSIEHAAAMLKKLYQELLSAKNKIRKT